MLETVATAVCGHEFGVDIIGIDSNATPEQHIEVLERDMGHVRTQDPGERGECRLARTVPDNPREITIEIEGGQGCGWSPAGIG